MTPRVKVDVRGTRRSVVVDAVLDTGFDGEISLPVKVAEKLGLELVGHEIFELADGSQTEELVFSGRATLEGKSRKVTILVSDSQDALIGTALLSDCQLMIDFSTGKVRIARKK